MWCLRRKTHALGGEAMYTALTLRSVCNSSSLKLPMQTPFFWTGDARFLSRERKWGSHHAAHVPQSLSHLCEKASAPSRAQKVRNIFMIFKKSGPPEWLLVCLGNYGKQYENTRHNIGFMAAERLIDKRDLRCNRLRFRALTEVIEFGGANVLLMMPQTYMNLSGEAVGEAARFYKIPADHVIVISDDISLPLGKLRVRGSGSAGGHNGLKNIIAHLGTDAFPRVKVGVGAPEHDIVDWVIGPFTASERKVIDGVLDRALGAAECIITDGVLTAQNRYNG